jgi:hypothetical protein
MAKKLVKIGFRALCSLKVFAGAKNALPYYFFAKKALNL